MSHSSAAEAAPIPERPAVAQRSCCAAGLSAAGVRVGFLFAWLASILAVDQASKLYAIEHLRPTANEPLVYADGLLRIQYAENPGAFLSLMRNFPPQARFWVLTVINGLVLAGLGVFLLMRGGDGWVWHALALIFAGGVGNLIDRILYSGHVIDFLNVGIGSLRTGIFNVADMAITAGFIMLLPKLLTGDKPAPQEASSKGNA